MNHVTLAVDDEHALFDTVIDAPASKRTFTFSNEGGGAAPTIKAVAEHVHAGAARVTMQVQ